MSDSDFNLLVALDILLSKTSVVGTARHLSLNTSAVSRTLSRLRDVTGSPILVHARHNMILTPWAEATRDRTRRTVHGVRAVLQLSTETFHARNLARLFAVRANDGFVMAFGPAFIAAVVDAASDVRIRFAPKPEKTSCYFREGLVDLGIGAQSNMGPETWLQRLLEDRPVGVVCKGRPLAKRAEIGVGDYIAWDYVVASPDDALHGLVDDALAKLGTKRRIASVIPGPPTALSVILESDLIAMIPTLYLLDQQVTNQVHAFELLFKGRRVTVSQMQHPRMKRDLGHRWLGEQILVICGVGRSVMIREPVQQLL